MNCNKARDAILTDYIDGQLDGKARARIEAHIAGCSTCGELLQRAQKAEGDAFKGAVRAEPPEYLWSRIKESVIVEPRKNAWTIGLRRPALAIATVAVLIMAAGVMVRLGAGGYPADQAEYLDYLADVTGNNAANVTADLGTPIEKYFL